MQARKDAARDLRAHHRDQYLDRQIYWNLRLASQMYSDVLVLIIDAMDKAKFAWPAWPFDRRPKELEHLCRPKMDFTAVLAHGYMVDIFMSNETLSHGSDFAIEVLSSTIQKARRPEDQ